MPIDSLSAFSTGDTAFEQDLILYVQNAIGQSIFPYKLPQKYELPALTYSLVDAQHLHNLDGAAGACQVRIQFDAYSTNYSDCVLLSEAMRGTLDGFQGTIGSYQVLFSLFDTDFGGYDANIDGSDRGAYHRSIDFQIQYVESIPNL